MRGRGQVPHLRDQPNADSRWRDLDAAHSDGLWRPTHTWREKDATPGEEGTQGSMGEIGESPFFDAIEIVVGMAGSHPGAKRGPFQGRD